MKLTSLLLSAALCASAAVCAESFSVTGRDGKDYQIEDLGRPVSAKETDVDAITTFADGSRVAWAMVASPDAFGLLGQKIKGEGTYWVDLKPYGYSRAEIASYQDKLYIVIAQPTVKALMLDTNTLEVTELRAYPECGRNAYWNAGHARTADDRMYVGLYPMTYVVGIDLKNGKALDLIRVQNDPAQKYIILPGADNNGILYCPVGLVRQELYAVNLATGESRELTKGTSIEQAARKSKGAPRVYMQKDGSFIALVAGKNFRCSFDGLTPIEFTGKHPKFPDNRRGHNLLAPKTHALRFTDKGLLISSGYGPNTKLTTVPVDFELPGIDLFGVHEERSGKLYGSSVFPGRIFEWDIAAGTAKDLGKLTGGSIQCYDIVSTPIGLVMSSYVSAFLDLYNPDQPKEAGKNPRTLGSLNKYDQERIQRLVRAGEHYVCGGTTPCKGLLGGGIVRVDLRNTKVEYFGNLIPNQSISALIAIPGTTLLCGTSSIAGGTGAITKAKNAEVFLWDYEKAEFVWRQVMTPGIASYGGHALTADNQVILWHFDKNKAMKWEVFDPATRKITASGTLDVKLKKLPYSHPLPAGQYKRNYFIANTWIGYFDPAERTVKTVLTDSRLNQDSWQYCHVTQDGTIYFPLGSRMRRIQLEK